MRGPVRVVEDRRHGTGERTGRRLLGPVDEQADTVEQVGQATDASGDDGGPCLLYTSDAADE